MRNNKIRAGIIALMVCMMIITSGLSACGGNYSANNETNGAAASEANESAASYTGKYSFYAIGIAQGKYLISADECNDIWMSMAEDAIVDLKPDPKKDIAFTGDIHDMGKFSITVKPDGTAFMETIGIKRPLVWEGENGNISLKFLPYYIDRLSESLGRINAGFLRFHF